MSKIDESILRMQEFINDIKTKAEAKANELEADGKTQVESIANKTINTIESSIAKLQEMKEKVGDDADLGDFLDRLEGKCKDVTAYTENKIEEIKPIIKENINDLKAELDKNFDDFKEDVKEVIDNSTDNLQDAIKDEVVEVKEVLEEGVKEAKEAVDCTYKKLSENDNIKNAIKLLNEAKDKAVEFYNKPETQEVINDAKILIIKAAEKGLETLKVVLEREDDKKNDNGQE